MGGIALAGANTAHGKAGRFQLGGTSTLDLSRVGDRDPPHTSHPSHPVARE